MKQVNISENLRVQLNIDEVLRAMHCDKDNPLYGKMTEEFYGIYDEATSLIKPLGILGFGELTARCETEKYPQGTRALYAALSVGDAIKKRSVQAFDDGDYVRGLMYDAMADCALFSLEGSMLESVESLCREYKAGICKRLEAPQDIPIESVREIWERLDLSSYGISITDRYMLDPVKTSCYIFVLSDNANEFNATHDCTDCPDTACKFRKSTTAKISVVNSENEAVFSLDKNESLMDGLVRNGFFVNAVCGGKGRCGKCKVRVIDGNAEVTTEDKAVFTQSELDDGIRLSCTMYPKTDIAVSLCGENEDGFAVISEHNSVMQNTDDCGGEYAAAIDIGTTTIAMQLVSKESGRVCHTVTAVNTQRRYGADVISRIQASTDGNGEELRTIIRTELQKGIITLCSEYGIAVDRVIDIAIAANTAMTHLLMGYDCTSLGKYPFKSVNIDFIEGSAADITGIPSTAAVTVLPGISAYVGGDIVSGLYECGFDRSDEVCLLIDLGTNGEMAIGNKDKILVTSASAGPAFEGGNIKWGTGSVKGAVCSVKIENSKAEVQTIADMPPVGICGTGVVEAVSELLRNGLIDETGLLADEYFENGFPLAKTADGESIVFTQKDVREIQLAKAAIRAGIEILLKRYGIDENDVSRVYIAGGFGYRLDIEKAAYIGMLPVSLAEKSIAVGNSSLGGCVSFLRENDGRKCPESIVSAAEEISLSEDEDFNEAYIKAMMF